MGPFGGRRHLTTNLLVGFPSGVLISPCLAQQRWQDERRCKRLVENCFLGTRGSSAPQWAPPSSSVHTVYKGAGCSQMQPAFSSAAPWSGSPVGATGPAPSLPPAYEPPHWGRTALGPTSRGCSLAQDCACGWDAGGMGESQGHWRGSCFRLEGPPTSPLSAASPLPTRLDILGK